MRQNNNGSVISLSGGAQNNFLDSDAENLIIFDTGGNNGSIYTSTPEIPFKNKIDSTIFNNLIEDVEKDEISLKKQIEYSRKSKKPFWVLQ